MRRAQGAVEFTLITSIMMLMFSFGFIIAEQRFAQIQQDRFDEVILSLLDDLEEEVELAALAGNGFTRDIEIPASIGGYPYQIQYVEGNAAKDAIWLRIEEQDYFVFLQDDVDPTSGLDPGKVHTISVNTRVVITPN